MKLMDLKAHLKKHPEATLRFALPSGEYIPIHAHVTEVARLDKRFIDCGGTLRTDSFCRLQTWHSDDLDHRLSAGVLLKIFEKAEKILLTDDLDVDVEHEVGVITQFPLEGVEATNNEITLRLGERHTDCLAKDHCKPAPQLPVHDIRKLNFREPTGASRCCGN